MRRIGAFLLSYLVVYAQATWYVRTDGGTDTQCTGQTNAAYSGGSAQPCAYKHPFYLLTSSTTWRIAAGDSAIIANGSYEIGYGAGNSSSFWSSSFPRLVEFPPLPNGVDSTHPTQILGEQWNSGCTTRPEFWGSTGIYKMWDFNTTATSWATGTSNISIKCLEITDHATCAYGWNTAAGQDPASSQCPAQYADYLTAPWAKNAFEGKYATNLTLDNVYIHGMAGSSWKLGPVRGLVISNTKCSENGLACFDFDQSTPDMNEGDITFTDFEISWSGCAETYPIPSPLTDANRCGWISGSMSQDGLGTAHTGGNWTFRRGLFAYNANDGLDLLYVDWNGGTSTIDRVMAVGNAGNQLKISGISTVTNSIAIGNCDYLAGLSSATPTVPICRAGGHTMVFALTGDAPVEFDNNTITDSPGNAGTGANELLYVCHGTSVGAQKDCNANSTLTGKNNLWYGLNTPQKPPWLYSDGATAAMLTLDHNWYYGTLAPYGGANETNATRNVDPKIINPVRSASFDGRLQSSSGLIDIGLTIPSITWDYLEVARPQGAGYDIGAYEHTNPFAITLGMGIFAGTAK